MSKMLLFVVAICIVFFNNCHKPCTEPDYNFKVSEAFYPERDSVNIGDSIWVICNFPKIQSDINTQAKINFSGAQNLGSNLIISDISKFNTQRGAVDSFSFFKITGDIYTDQSLNPKGVKQISFAEIDTAYQLKVGLIALKTGLYIFTIPDVPGVYRNGQTKCGIGNFQILNANVNKHLYLFENLWSPLSPYDAAHCYCVKVK